MGKRNRVPQHPGNHAGPAPIFDFHVPDGSSGFEDRWGLNMQIPTGEKNGN
jgi:hypothetical protein